jgi:hypothetical protein
MYLSFVTAVRVYSYFVLKLLLHVFRFQVAEMVSEFEGQPQNILHKKQMGQPKRGGLPF